MASAPQVPERMMALVYRGRDDLRIEELPVPKIRADEVLVRVEACGICPTDLKKIHQGLVPPPRVFGHETAGTLVRIGSRVQGFRVGDRVAVHHHVPCRICHCCRRGAFAQCPQYHRTGVTAGFEPAGGGFAGYARVMSFCLPGLVRIPPGATMAEAAMLEPVNTVLKGVRALGVHKGDTVLVVGQGPVGLLFNRLLTLEGASVLACDPLEQRRRMGRHFGARWSGPAVGASDLAEAVRRRTRGRGLDAAVITAPSDAAFLESIPLLRGGGSVLVFAHTVRGREVPVDLGRVCVDEIRVLGSYSSDITLQDEVADLVFSRRLDVRPLITHQVPLSRAAEAMGRVAAPSEGMLKVVVVG
ncbi:MAG: alcohol dehydrogenase catalytic domain-containing protein [Verrucomicrobiae bacterium]|nr:alcohol dehydrogenase catalytic domain-containing protein [Verrucomicrobiae bacterium]